MSDTLTPDTLDKARREAKRRLIAEAAVLVRQMQESAERARERLEELKASDGEWEAIEGVLAEVFGMPERALQTDLMRKYVVYKLTDLEMRRSINVVARQFGLVE